MTPEEAALLSARLGGSTVGQGIAPSLTQADAFRQRVMGLAPRVALDTAQQVPGIGPVVAAGRVADAGLGMADPAMQARARETAMRNMFPPVEETASGRALEATGLVHGGPGDLSKKAQTTIANREEVTSPGGTVMRPMYTPDVNVEAAPTLDPNYGKDKKPATGGGGVGANPGIGLKARLDAARAAGLKTMEEERDLTGQLGVDKAGRIMSVASLNEAEAARQQQAAEEQQRIDAAAAAKHQAFLARSEELTDELGKMKTDPGRLLRNADAKTQFSFALGATLAGGNAMLNGSNGNSSLDRVERIIDRDIHSQEQEIDNKKAQLTERNSLFGQMLQETGDRRLAAQQTRIMMLEAAKLKIQADSDRLGIPEVRTNAELATNAIQQKIDSARTGMAKEAYETFLRQAAAAEAARRAAEERAWQRSMDVAKLGLEKDKLAIEAAKTNGTTSKELDERVQKLGTALADPKLQSGRAVTDALLAAVQKTKKGEQMPGLGVGSDIVRYAVPFGERLLSDEQNVNKQNWEDFLGVLRQQRTGSGGSEKEMANIRKEAEGASTAAERENVIRKASAFFKAQEDAHRAAAGPDASAKYDANRQTIAAQMPASVQVKK